MFKFFTALLAYLTINYSCHAENLSIERIHSDPSLSGNTPRNLQYSPDGKRVTYLKSRSDDALQYDLWEYNIDRKKNRLLVDSKTLFKGKETLSEEEKSRRERQRVYGRGIMEYRWQDNGSTLLFPLGGELYVYDLNKKKVRQITHTAAFETDARFSPKGNYVSYIRNNNLYIYDLSSEQEIAVTNETSPYIKHGMAEFVAQEEMGRMTGYWWTEDESKIAFTKIDESSVPIAVRHEIYAEKIETIKQRYPYAGTNNVSIELGIFTINNKNTEWVDTGKETDFYIPRVAWLPDNETLSYQWQSRDQKTLELRFYQPHLKKQKKILTEASQTWINLHKDLYFLEDSSGFIWASERDGYNHLYFYPLSEKNVLTAGKAIQLTKGNWVVEKLHTVDKRSGNLFFSGRKDTPLESHLYSVNLKNPNVIHRISQRKGFHKIAFANDASGYIDNFSTAISPPQVSLHDKHGNRITWLNKNNIDHSHPLSQYQENWVKPEFNSLTTQSGEVLHYRLQTPQLMKPGKKYPVIVRVYGGPHAQRVRNQWRKQELWNQYMIQQGYIIFQLDNRGSNYRGKNFEAVLYGQLGQTELEDQITGVKYLHTLPYVDRERIGIYGHSYGGYLTLMAMFKAGQYFKAGVAGAPVTDWQIYDTHYTERYLGHPESNAEGYRKSAVFPYASQLKNPLLIYHGMADDNVLFTHSTRLYKQLQNHGIMFEMADYPGSKHSMRGKSVKTHLDKTITTFFNRHFKK